MNEEMQAAILSVLERLQTEAKAKAVLLFDKKSQLISRTDYNDQVEGVSVSGFLDNSPDGLDTFLAEKVVIGTGIYASIPANRVFLYVSFGTNTSLGVVQLRVKRATKELESIIDESFPEITDADIVKFCKG